MSQIQDINWSNFKAKFDGRLQSSFEWLSYLLFCNEFGNKTGIFRYKNQVGIETEPILFKGKWIGFQSKFYEAKISEKKEDIKDSIKKAKTKNPNLNKILFYVNREFSESTKKNQKEPQYKMEIEAYAKTKGLEIEWRVRSHFEKQLSLPENHSIAQHFFSLEKSVIDFICELIRHTESILAHIHSKIIFKETEIKIDRTGILDCLRNTKKLSPIVIISGEGGVGKTAVIKDFYEEIEETTPFFIFKATEFNISNINDLLKSYGNFTLSDFIGEYKEINNKHVVIDSAEKLSDIEDREIFQEFLTTLVRNNWKIIFTTRHSYLDDLRFLCKEVLQYSFHVVNINNLSKQGLITISKNYNFNLPKNDRLFKLIQNPFYLDEYLQEYNINKTSIDYFDFKKTLWNKHILNTSYRRNNIHLRREKCFLEISKARAETGKFYVQAENCDNEILTYLETDEIIKYDTNTGGYFITHEIYEEWALDKIIEREYQGLEDYKTFFKKIGSSLPIRRAFRNWLSEKLLSTNNDIYSLIEDSFVNNDIEKFWRDEVFVSVLLSDYSEAFFRKFEKTLLADNQNLLLKSVFLLRIACKEIDENILNQLGLHVTEGITLKTLFTKPKGNGWKSVIYFIHNHIKFLGLKNYNKILPMLNDWNSSNKRGETTKKASLIALFYYEKITEKDYTYNHRDEGMKQLIRVILHGASEIEKELSIIFEEVLSKKLTEYTDQYYDIINTILTSITDGIGVVMALPTYVLKLADLFWFQIPKNNLPLYRQSRIDIEQYFGISRKLLEYYPSSAFQTPVLQLLRFNQKVTIDFIISFTNKTVECYSKSNLKDEIEEVQLYIDENTTKTQVISNRLWNMYRGTQGSTHLLESIHMALEKWLLEKSKTTTKEELEEICIYLIKKSRSASITAVVASIVLAYPDKLFNIAKILFKTKEFFLYDSSRMVIDQTALGLYSMGYGLNRYHDLYVDERIETCKDSHRKKSLENIAVYYQFFKIEEISEEEVKERQKTLWDIWDNYYHNLPDKGKETESDKVWRLYLARMDSRKMKPTTVEKDSDTLIHFNPEIDPELKKHSDESLQKHSEVMKYSSLRLWSYYRFKENEKEYKKYKKYEDSPKQALLDTREIIEELKKNTKKDFSKMNQQIPAYSCSVLIRDFFNKLNRNEQKFCKDVIIDSASMPVKNKQYSYQAGDGTEPSITILSELINHFQKDKKEIKKLLFLLLLNPWNEISTFATRSILLKLWENSFEDAHSIFLGYILLNASFEENKENIRKENVEKGIFKIELDHVYKRFTRQYQQELKLIMSNRIAYDNLDELINVDLKTLIKVFELLPPSTKNEDHSKFLNTFFPLISRKISQSKYGKRYITDENEIDYTLKNRFFNKFAYFILKSTEEEIENYIKSFVENFLHSQDMADLFLEFIFAEDILNQYEEFWIVWNSFYSKIVELVKNDSSYHYSKSIIYNYLLAISFWRENAKEWHSLKEREKSFYEKVSHDMGHHPSVLYSISKVLNDIGSNFINDGVLWLSYIFNNNANLLTSQLEVNTLYYIENIARRFISMNRQKIKTNRKMKERLISILDFLIEKGSATGYLLREDIL